MPFSNITLHKTDVSDLETLFVFQQDHEAVFLAAFTAKDPNDKAFYIERYTRFLADPTINMHTIKLNNIIVGSISKY